MRFVEKKDTLKSDRIVEGAVPWAAGRDTGGEVGFFLQVPSKKSYSKAVRSRNISPSSPDPDFEAKLWLFDGIAERGGRFRGRR